jgi:putative endonuclease
MQYVYLIQSQADPQQRYVGTTEDLRERIQAHNAGQSVHTAKYKPWKIVAYFAFEVQDRALRFEKYLKSGSGRAFANRHL